MDWRSIYRYLTSQNPIRCYSDISKNFSKIFFRLLANVPSKELKVVATFSTSYEGAEILS